LCWLLSLNRDKIIPFKKRPFLFEVLFMRRIIYLVSLVLLFSWGCHKKSTVISPVVPPVKPPITTSATPPPAVTPPMPAPPKPAPLEPALIPAKITIPSSLDLGEMNFQTGKYTQAAKFYDDFLTIDPKPEKRDLALFHLGLSRALANDSSRDTRLAEAAFKRLISECPTSPYRSQAEYILGLQQQVDKMRSDLKDREERLKKLSEELQKLKEIDLQRRPSRPPE